MLQKIIWQTTLAMTGLMMIISCSCTRTEEQADCTERIDPACICPMDYNPVCGCNRKTYSNACTAECSGIKKYTPGACKK